MKLVFERSRPGAGTSYFSANDVEICVLPEHLLRETPLRLPELSETQISRHYTKLASEVFGVNNGFYPL